MVSLDLRPAGEVEDSWPDRKGEDRKVREFAVWKERNWCSISLNMAAFRTELSFKLVEEMRK